MIKKLKELINKSKKIVVFTGAGISCAPPTNIPDFRSPNGLYQTLYNNLRPEEIISHSFFFKNTKLFFEFYFSNMVYKDAPYNAAHLYFAELEKEKEVSIITQNIDSLHQKAGSKDVYELHGSVKRNYCTKCNKYYDLNDLNLKEVPICICGGIIKPDVVLYEEPLDNKTLEYSIKKIMDADLLIVVGTSLTVFPASGLINYFNKDLVIINKSKTPFDYKASIVINDDIINVVNKLKE